MISGAAICAAAQSSKGAVKQKTVEPSPAVQAKSKQKKSSDEKSKAEQSVQPPASPAAVKQNTREGVAVSTASAPIATPDKVRYSYEFTQPQFFIRRIQISHDENGRGEISFERKDSDAAIVDPIELSTAALGRVKALWDSLRFIDSNASYQSERQLPHLGTMRLGMTKGERERFAEFNWTNDQNAFALVNEYKRIADQAIFIFNITLARENQPLEAPKLMDELDRLYKRDGLSDAQQLVPLLRELTNDERIPLIARNHAGRLLKQILK